MLMGFLKAAGKFRLESVKKLPTPAAFKNCLDEC
jgi:hypothetical protein